MEIRQVYEAFADETRLRLLNLLSRKPCCVNDLVAILGVTQTKVSRHLSRLKAAGVVQDARKGQKTYYSLKEHWAGVPRRHYRGLFLSFRVDEVFGRDLRRLKQHTALLRRRRG